MDCSPHLLQEHAIQLHLHICMRFKPSLQAWLPKQGVHGCWLHPPGRPCSLDEQRPLLSHACALVATAL